MGFRYNPYRGGCCGTYKKPRQQHTKPIKESLVNQLTSINRSFLKSLGFTLLQ